ncbi:MAG: MarR family transcriptional regulator [Bacteroidetes bacterium]|nr:MarR family transcriptional regulator [Bacteroidota bacterium]
MGNTINMPLFAFSFRWFTENCYLFVTRINNNPCKINIYRELPSLGLFFPQMRPEIIQKPAVVLKPEEVLVLDEVKKLNPATIASISESLGISKNQLQKLLNSLEERKLVKREGPVYQPVVG